MHIYMFVDDGSEDVSFHTSKKDCKRFKNGTVHEMALMVKSETPKLDKGKVVEALNDIVDPLAVA